MSETEPYNARQDVAMSQHADHLRHAIVNNQTGTTRATRYHLRQACEAVDSALRYGVPRSAIITQSRAIHDDIFGRLS